MASSRSVIAKPDPEKRRVFKTYKRYGAVSQVERELVSKFVADQPRELSRSQVCALARVLRRSREVVKQLIEDAREEFVASAHDYVKMHKKAVTDALSNGDPKSLEVAVRGSQWAMENLAAEGVRVIDKPTASESGTKILVGVKIGGLVDTSTAITEITVPPSPPLSDSAQ